MTRFISRLVRVRRVQIGLGLVLLCWPLNWGLPGYPTAYLFFPLWLGYILVMDGLVELTRGSSPWTRSRGGFCGLFVASAPGWWLFEMLNTRTRNWEYLGGDHFNGFVYTLLSTLSFSTVMPAVFETAEWMRGARWVSHFQHGPAIPVSRKWWFPLLSVGAVMLTLVLAWPGAFYPLMWGSIYLIFEAVNLRLDRRVLLQPLGSGDWRPVVSLALGALVCGFFWEMWNFYSYPKWIYRTPGAQFAYLFEMPALGYGGYLPFAWELFALKNFLWPGGPPLQL